LVLDGAATGLDLDGFSLLRQGSGDLSNRLSQALEDAKTMFSGPTILIGMDTPQVRPEHLCAALQLLVEPAGPESVLGPTPDGGWWLLGVRRPDGCLTSGIPTSTSSTGADRRHAHPDQPAPGLAGAA
jgi:glycosyltransferase A (GT-A) superfamily protein (DUF2064 family)